ncbi:MAG: rhodanese-like domain-containing protein [Azoarcus sp.]|nr:rhodanese-like domain-containing protein [Azoarcus sp.]
MEFLQQKQNMIWIALAVFSGLWLLYEMIRQLRDKSLLTPFAATMLINREDAVVIDVRDQGDFDQGHLPNARHMPLGEIERRSSELEKFRTRPLILYCGSGSRAATAISTLKKAGFEKLYNLRGGLSEWESAGHPLTRKKK